MINRKKSCYVITKPIQYINATNIEDNNIKDCYVTNTFSDAKQFSEKIKEHSRNWNNVFFVTTKHRALIKILKHKSKYSRLYLDSDLGIVLRFLLFLLYPLQIYVYEEGLVSYVKEVRKKEKNILNLFKHIVDHLFGENWSGGSFRTEGIYLYHPNAFKSLVNTNKNIKIHSFKKSLRNHLETLSDINIFHSSEMLVNFKDKKILLYLTSWSINSQYEKIYNRYPDFAKVIKFHPHIKKEDVAGKLLHFEYYPHNNIPAEILITNFLEKSDKIVIIHEGSSAMLNFLNEDKIIEYNIANNKYNEMYLRVKNEFEKIK